MLQPKIFYAEGATPPGSNAPTTLTYNYGGETITVDLSNPDSVKLAQDRLSKGHNMEKIAEERNKLRDEAANYKQQLDAWNQRLEAAKNNPDEFKALVGDLEAYIGKPLTRQEKQDLVDADLDMSDPLAKKLLAMEQKLTSFQQEQVRKEELRERSRKEEEAKNYARQLIAELDRMEKDTANYPGFNRDAVYQKAVDSNTDNFEMVYYYLNRDALTKAERAKVEKEYKELTNQRKAAATEGDTTPASLSSPPKTFSKIEDVGKSVREEMAKAGKSFFTEE